MRDLFEEISSGQPFDPVEAVRRNMAPRRRRFYERVEAVSAPSGQAVALDGRTARTPARRPLAAPNSALAEALAAEWRAQGEFIDPMAMPLTRLANAILDGVAAAPAATAAEIAKYLGCDLVCYRAAAPETLHACQALHWDPVIAWARDACGARFTVSTGVMFAPQAEGAVATMRAAIPRDPWRLGAVHAITTLTGSALIALMIAAGAIKLGAAWAAAHVTRTGTWIDGAATNSPSHAAPSALPKWARRRG